MYPLKTSALPVSASSLEKDVLKNRIGHSLDSRVYGWKHGHFARLDRTLTRLCEYWRYHQKGFLSGVNGSLASWLRHITICNTKLTVKLCQFLMKFDWNSSFLCSILHTSEHHVIKGTLLRKMYSPVRRIARKQWNTSAFDRKLSLSGARKIDNNKRVIYIFFCPWARILAI